MMNHNGMHTRWTIVGWVLLVALTAFPASAADDVRSAIEAANKKWEAAASRSDGAGVAALYTAHGELLPAQSDFVRGTQAIGRFWQAVFDSGIKGASLSTVEVEGCGHTAYETGTYELRDADGKALDHGKYVVVWKREGDAWKLHRDIWTTSIVPAKR
ncbi:MAG: YybH family protein [Acidobacteriota bacterium]